MAIKSKKLMYSFTIGENGTINAGPRTRNRMAKEIKENYPAGTRIKMIVKKDRKLKTPKQLGYYYGVVLPHFMYAMINAGENLQIDNQDDVDMVDRLLKKKYLNNGTRIRIADEEMKAEPSLATADTEQVAIMIDDIITDCMEFYKHEVPAADEDYTESEVLKLIDLIEEKQDKETAA